MKILAVGCSFTAGFELPDCNEIGQISKYSYPSLLGDLYNADVKNISLSGGSNGRIFRKVIDELSKFNYDIVICGWTTTERLDLHYQGKDIPSAMGSKNLNNFPWIKEYYIHHHDYHHSIEIWLAQLIALQSFLKDIKQKYIFINMFPPDIIALEDQTFKHLVDKIDKTYFIGWPMYGMVDFMGDCPKGPGGHPLELGHQRIAEKINEHIRNLGWIS